MTKLTERERHILEHATGWNSDTPLYRNHFCAAPGHSDWPTLDELCDRGLMRSRPVAALSEVTGGDELFTVTREGVSALIVAERKDRKRKRTVR